VLRSKHQTAVTRIDKVAPRAPLRAAAAALVAKVAAFTSPPVAAVQQAAAAIVQQPTAADAAIVPGVILASAAALPPAAAAAAAAASAPGAKEASLSASSLYFDGNSFVRVSSPLDTAAVGQALTASAWVRMSGTNTEAQIKTIFANKAAGCETTPDHFGFALSVRPQY
jgi:hypothetical protein